MEWNKLMCTRNSCREYSDQQITAVQLKALLQAGCAAPVARGKFEQLQITVVQNKELLDMILSRRTIFKLYSRKTPFKQQ